MDGIGGFLICLSPRVTFGQAAAEALVDVPLVADVSRLHATLTRDAEGYLLEGVRALQVNSQPVTRALLRQGDRVTLGPSCQFVFRQPVPVSTTARLDLVSGHRLPLAADGRAADGGIPGDRTWAPQLHIVVPDMNAPVVVFRHRDGPLYLGARGPLTVNGEPLFDKTLLSATIGGNG